MFRPLLAILKWYTKYFWLVTSLTTDQLLQVNNFLSTFAYLLMLYAWPAFIKLIKYAQHDAELQNKNSESLFNLFPQLIKKPTSHCVIFSTSTRSVVSSITMSSILFPLLFPPYTSEGGNWKWGLALRSNHNLPAVGKSVRRLLLVPQTVTYLLQTYFHWWVGSGKLLLVIVSKVILDYEPRGPHNLVLLFKDSLNPGTLTFRTEAVVNNL
jgi:hypothetical protein